jgi:hypothetical protein
VAILAAEGALEFGDQLDTVRAGGVLFAEPVKVGAARGTGLGDASRSDGDGLGEGTLGQLA